MHTLVDFVTHVKGVEYVLSLLAIAGFLLFWEVLKPAPFRSVVAAGRDDLAHIRVAGGMGGVARSLGKIAAAPFIGLAYVLLLPIGFLAVLLSAVVNLVAKGAARLVGESIAFEWRPVEAYFAGRKRKKAKKAAGKAEGAGEPASKTEERG